MVKHLHVWMGLHVENLSFVQLLGANRDPFTKGFALEKTSTSMRVLVPNGYHRRLIEGQLNRQLIRPALMEFLSLAEGEFANLSTHSFFVLEELALLVKEGVLSASDITVHQMSDSNAQQLAEVSPFTFTVNYEPGCDGRLSASFF